MASQLSVKQKRQLCEHKTALQNDGKKMPYKDQLAYYQEHFKQSPSETAISRIWKDREKLFTEKESEKGVRIRGCSMA
jgi:hypothetical protein